MFFNTPFVRQNDLKELNMSSKEKITICIPTKNRADFLVRLLHYFADAKYQHWIFIGDSSNDLDVDKTKKTIQSVKGRLKVKHFECPGLSDVEAIEHLNQFITTPYCAFLADDDFLCVRGVNRCIDFLESNPDYGAAHGAGIATNVDGSGPYGNISRVHYYQQTTLNADSGSQRLRDYFAAGPYALIFSVHRTPDWREMHQGFMSMPWARQGFLFGELIPSSISSVRNKVKQLDCLYLVRFGHYRVYHQVYVYAWFTSQDWFPGFKNLHDRVIDELIRQDGIGEKEAEEVFKQAFWPYLGRLFSRGQPSPKPGVILRLKKIAGQIPGLRAAYIQIMSQFQEKAKEEINLLPSLLKPSSPYHEDFMPIYRAITNPINLKKQEV